jgi:glycosyltransferase involved in cell wall biosynthesis
MRVLMISDVSFPRVNGVSTSIRTFRNDLAALGVHSLLIAPQYPGGLAAEDPDVIRIRSRRVPRDPEDRLMSLGEATAAGRAAYGSGFDLIHSQTPFVAHYAARRLAREFRVPLVETYHTYFEHYLHHYVPALPTRVTRRLARYFTVSQCGDVDVVISPSRAMADALRAYGVRSRIEILPTGLDAGRFQPGDGASFRVRHGIEAGRPVALFVGRVAFEKNIEFLVRMWPRVLAQLPQALLIIAGEGPAASQLRALVATLHVERSVQFLGYLERERELSGCYQAADAFVFASRTETQGLVLLEALAQGTPVISTAVMGTIDVLAGSAGSIVVEEDAAAFAAAVIRVLGSPPERARLARDARSDARRWSSRAMAERLIELYRTLGATPATRVAVGN